MNNGGDDIFHGLDAVLPATTTDTVATVPREVASTNVVPAAAEKDGGGHVAGNASCQPLQNMVSVCVASR